MLENKYIVTCLISRDAQLYSYDNYDMLSGMFFNKFNKAPEDATNEELSEFLDDVYLEELFGDEDRIGAWFDANGEVVVGIVFAESEEEAIEQFINNPFDRTIYSAYQLHN